MKTNLMTEKDLLVEFAGKTKNISINIDDNPSPEKVSRLKAAIERKKKMMSLATDAYKTVSLGL